MIKRLEVSDKENETSEKSAGLNYLPEAKKISFGERLTRNLALAGMMILTITAVRNAKMPDGKTVLTAIQNTVDHQWDDNLGKISFVSNIFPEAVSVFFAESLDIPLVAPCFGVISHPWSVTMPYLSYTSDDRKVYSVASGQVMGLGHGLNEEKIVRIRYADGIEALYYQLADLNVSEGDFVDVNTCIGECLEDGQTVIEIRKDGLPIDPTEWMKPRISNQL